MTINAGVSSVVEKGATESAPKVISATRDRPVNAVSIIYCNGYITFVLRHYTRKGNLLTRVVKQASDMTDAALFCDSLRIKYQEVPFLHHALRTSEAAKRDGERMAKDPEGYHFNSRQLFCFGDRFIEYCSQCKMRREANILGTFPQIRFEVTAKIPSRSDCECCGQLSQFQVNPKHKHGKAGKQEL